MTAASPYPEITRLAEGLGAAPDLTLRVGTTVIHLQASVGGKGALLGARFWISIGAPIAPYEIVFRHEGALDRAGKQLRVNHEVQTGDEAFDRDVYIETDGLDDDVRRLLSEGRVRDPIRAIVTEKVDRLILGGDPLVEGNLLRVSFGTKAFGEVESLRRALVALARLAEELAEPTQASPYRGGARTEALAPAKRSRIGRGLVLVTICIAANLAGWWGVGFDATPPTHGWSAFGAGCAGGVVAWLALVVGAGALLRGRSTSLRYVVVFALAAAPTVLAGGRIAERENAALDTSPHRTVKGTAIFRSRSKGGPAREVTLDASGIVFVVDAPRARAVAFSYTAKPIVATIGDGALGSPYLVSLDASPGEAGGVTAP
ncbi:MAG: hypothetical protein JST00_32860 [Deltaproteobacteria bacterium]|nr:hypothetical protein [Deltaproteobacteria bacterium]